MLDSQPAPDKLRFWLRLCGLLIGFLFLVWLPFEDVDVVYTISLAIAVGAWLLLRLIYQKQYHLWQFALSGSVFGLLVSPLALTLMAFKSSLHAHGFSDFALPQIRTVLAATPWFILGGLLLGLAIYTLNRPA
ncbi:MAG: hypothetical protein DWQ07_04730 [Chloroflexi bacterium]|nr:MAG: hypothetical protein DWQ07_04730 [Chloroflexota bacterium]MBL1194736.1 hypothetical protein [Chloroflexota bacterium]